MNEARQPLLARAGLPDEQHGRARGRDEGRLPRELAHLRIVAVAEHGGVLGDLADTALERGGPLLALEARAGEPLVLAQAMDREREQAPEDLGEINHGARIRAAPRAVDRHDAEDLGARHEGHDHTRVAVREVHQSVEEVAVAVGVVFLREDAAAALLDGQPNGREIVEADAILADLGPEVRAAPRPRAEQGAVELEDDGEIVRREAAEPFEAPVQELVERLRRPIRELRQNPRARACSWRPSRRGSCKHGSRAVPRPATVVRCPDHRPVGVAQRHLVAHRPVGAGSAWGFERIRVVGRTRVLARAVLSVASADADAGAARRIRMKLNHSKIKRRWNGAGMLTGVLTSMALLGACGGESGTDVPAPGPDLDAEASRRCSRPRG